MPSRATSRSLQMISRDQKSRSSPRVHPCGDPSRAGQTRFFTMIVFAAGVMGLARLSFHVARQAHELEPASRSGAGIIVRTEPIRLWLPQTLIEPDATPVSVPSGPNTRRIATIPRTARTGKTSGTR